MPPDPPPTDRDELWGRGAAAGTTLRPATAADASAIAVIYNHYIAHTIITFEEVAVDAGEMASRIAAVQVAGYPWLVAEQGDLILGYAYANQWKNRCAYRLSAELTAYLDPRQLGRGVGSMLYAQLIDALRPLGIHAIMGGIALPNDASVALHEKFGLVKVAHFREIGFKFGRWIDVGYWQRVMGSTEQE